MDLNCWFFLTSAGNKQEAWTVLNVFKKVTVQPMLWTMEKNKDEWKTWPRHSNEPQVKHGLSRAFSHVNSFSHNMAQYEIFRNASLMEFVMIIIVYVDWIIDR